MFPSASLIALARTGDSAFFRSSCSPLAIGCFVDGGTEEGCVDDPPRLAGHSVHK